MKKAAAISLAAAAIVVIGGVLWYVTRPTPTLPDPPRPSAPDQLDIMVSRLVDDALAAVAADPTSAEHRAELGMIYHANGLVPQAAESYEQALTADGRRPRWWYHLARARASLGDYEGALAALDRTEALGEEHPPLHWRRGFFLLEIGRLEEAAQAFATAARLAPRDLAPQVGLARTDLLSGRPEQAVARLEPLVQLDPQNAYLHQLLGTALQQTGRRLPEAAAHLTMSSGVKPIWPDAWVRQLARYRTGFSAIMQRADALVGVGRYDEAVAAVQELRRHHPDDGILAAKVGEIQLGQGDDRRAEQSLQEALKLDPRCYFAHLHLSRLYQQRDDMDRAMAHVDRTIQLHPSLGPAYRQKADLYIVQRDWPGAETALAQAIRYGYAEPETHVDLASAQYQQNKIQAAQDTLRGVVSTYPFHFRGLLLMAAVTGQLGDIPTATTLVQRANQVRPNDPAVQQTMQLLRQLQEGRPPP